MHVLKLQRLINMLNLICSIFKSTEMRKHVEIEAMLNLNAMLNLVCPILKVT